MRQPRTCSGRSLSQCDSRAGGVIRGPSLRTACAYICRGCGCVGATLLLEFGENSSPGFTRWCVLVLLNTPGSAHTSAPSMELWLNPEESGKANGQERGRESPNCPVAGVAERLHSQTVKRICVATLVREVLAEMLAAV